jgi:hypothetical protein
MTETNPPRPARPSLEERSLREDVRDLRSAVARLDEKIDRQNSALNERLDRINIRLDILIDALSAHIRDDH